MAYNVIVYTISLLNHGNQKSSYKIKRAKEDRFFTMY